MEIELCWSKSGKVAILHKPSTLRTIIIFDEVRKCAVTETKGNPFTFNILLAYHSNNLNKSGKYIENVDCKSLTQWVSKLRETVRKKFLLNLTRHQLVKATWDMKWFTAFWLHLCQLTRIIGEFLWYKLNLLKNKNFVCTFQTALEIIWLPILIIYKQQFLHSDWLRACQLIPNQSKKVQKGEVECKTVKLKWLTAPTLSSDKQKLFI